MSGQDTVSGKPGLGMTNGQKGPLRIPFVLPFKFDRCGALRGFNCNGHGLSNRVSMRAGTSSDRDRSLDTGRHHPLKHPRDRFSAQTLSRCRTSMRTAGAP
jgi:hypothetical protein